MWRLGLSGDLTRVESETAFRAFNLLLEERLKPLDCSDGHLTHARIRGERPATDRGSDVPDRSRAKRFVAVESLQESADPV